MINNAMSVNAAHKLRFAQDLALYNLDLTENIEGFDGAVHKEVWRRDPVWQGVRENVERLTAIWDWAEALFATNVIFESLVGELFRSELVMQIAARNGDYTTPTIMGVGENDAARDLSYTRALFTMLVTDEKHGAQNIETLQQWADRWLPVSLAAARQLQPLWSQPAERVIRFEDSLERARERLRGVLADLRLNDPEVTAR